MTRSFAMFRTERSTFRITVTTPAAVDVFNYLPHLQSSYHTYWPCTYIHARMSRISTRVSRFQQPRAHPTKHVSPLCLKQERMTISFIYLAIDKHIKSGSHGRVHRCHETDAGRLKRAIGCFNTCLEQSTMQQSLLQFRAYIHSI